jgi:monofunctional biosynthetic peptidoglycan transglycosylase
MPRSPSSPAPRPARRLARLLATTALVLGCFSVLQVGALIFIDPPVTMPAVIEWGRGQLEGRPVPLARPVWRRIWEISPYLRQAVMAAEDQRFLAHHGFDLVELGDAVRQALEDGKVRGASTISMQAARSIFLWRGRDVPRKVLEAYYTVLMELLLTKARIYELYLNTVHWGPGLIGAEAAARAWFNTDAGRLGPEQASLLAVILPNPEQWSPRRPGPYLAKRQRWVLACMDNIPLLGQRPRGKR